MINLVERTLILKHYDFSHLIRKLRSINFAEAAKDETEDTKGKARMVIWGRPRWLMMKYNPNELANDKIKRAAMSGFIDAVNYNPELTDIAKWDVRMQLKNSCGYRVSWLDDIADYVTPEDVEIDTDENLTIKCAVDGLDDVELDMKFDKLGNFNDKDGVTVKQK